MFDCMENTKSIYDQYEVSNFQYYILFYELFFKPFF